MREMIREKTRPPEAVHVGAVEDAERQGQQSLHDPAGMRRAAGDIDDRQSRERDIFGAERAAWIAAEILQAARVGWIRRGGGNAAKSGARADCDAITGSRRERSDPVEHATPGPGEPVEKSRAIGSMQDRALDAQHVEHHVSALDFREDRPRFRPGFLAYARMPQQVYAETAQFLEPAGRAPFQNGHRASAATAGLQPEHIKGFRAPHSFSSFLEMRPIEAELRAFRKIGPRHGFGFQPLARGERRRGHDPSPS